MCFASLMLPSPEMIGADLPNGFFANGDGCSIAPRVMLASAGDNDATGYVLKASSNAKAGETLFDDLLLAAYNSSSLPPSTSQHLRSLWGMLQSKGKESADKFRYGFHALCLLLSNNYWSMGRAVEMLRRPTAPIQFDMFGIKSKEDAAVPVGIATMMCKVSSGVSMDPVDGALCLLAAQHKGLVLFDTAGGEQVLGLFSYSGFATSVRLKEAANVSQRMIKTADGHLILRCQALRDIRSGDEIRLHVPRKGGILSESDRSAWMDDILAIAGSAALPAASIAEKMSQLASAATPESLLSSIQRMSST